MNEERQIYPETVGDAVKVHNPLDENSEGNDTNLNTVLNELATSGGGGGGTIPLNFPAADLRIGSILPGTNLGGKTWLQFVDMVTHVDYAPIWADATASISAKIGSIVEVGTIIPTIDVENFNIVGMAARAIGGAFFAYGGIPTNAITCNVQGVGTVKTTFGNVVYTLTREYAAGTDIVKSSKGNPTNKTASNATTLLDVAIENDSIDEETKTIIPITKTANCTISFVDAFYANTAAIGTMAKLPLISANSIELDYPAETSSAKHSFSLPASYQNVQIYIWNAVSNGGEWQLYAGTFTQSSETKTLADGETTKTYTKYTRNDGTNPATKFKVTFTKA